MNRKPIDKNYLANTLKSFDEKILSKKYTHPSGTNPHGITKEDVDLGNVPNVTTNDQTPTYTETSSLEKLKSGEKLSVAFGKISKAITDLISHIGDSVKHITSTERTNWDSAKTHADSAHAPSNAQANVIETVKVNGTALTPSSKAVDVAVPSVGNGTITIKQAGTTKGTFTTNQSGNTTIELTDNNTTYTSKDAVSGGTDVSLVTTGEKATWNAKTSNAGTITGIKMNGASKGTSGVVDLGNVITAHQDISNKSDVGHKHTKSEITDFPTSMTPTAHNQASNTINAMTGYSKPSSASAISTSDTLNVAIGKLEKALDGKGTSNLAIGTTSTTAAAGNHTHSTYVNQNAFSNVVVGSTTISADSTTDSLTLAGSNVTITPDATNDKVTIGITKNNVISALGYTPGTSTTEPISYTLSKTGTTITLTGSDGTTTSVSDSDTKYTHPTTTGNKHIPSGGSVGQVLKYSADGTAKWEKVKMEELSDFSFTSDVTVSSVIYHTFWKVAPTTENQVYGLSIHPTNGKLYRIYNNKGTYSVYAYDSNTTYSNFVKSGSTAKAGLVPSPGTTAGTAKFLREDATWQVPPKTPVVDNLTSTVTTSALSAKQGKILDEKKVNKSDSLTLAEIRNSTDLTGKVASAEAVKELIDNLLSNNYLQLSK